VNSIIEFWNSHPRMQQAVWVVLAALVVMALVKAVNHFFSRKVRDPATRYRMRKFISFTGYTLVAVYALVSFSGRLGEFAVAFGLVGAGIALALQEVITSVAGWASVSTGFVFRTGDRVRIGDVLGDVIDTGFLRTTLMELGEWVAGDQYNGRMVKVPNSLIFKAPVYNYSGDFPFLWDEVSIPVRYGSDLEEMRRILRDIANEVVGDYVPVAAGYWEKMLKKYFIEKASIEPAITILADENWVTFTLRYVVDLKKRRSTKDRLFTGILDRIARTEGRVSVGASTLEVSLKQTPQMQ